jgi:YVTN family beta-propeller protein
MIRLLKAGTFALALGWAGSCAAQWLVVLNKSDHNAALVDPATQQVAMKLPTGQGPHEAAVAPDGRTAYVSNYGAFAIFKEGERPRMTPGSSITVLDLKGRAVKATFELGEYRSPHGLAVSRDGKLLWVTCEANQAVLELDAASGRILRTWTTGQQVSHMIVSARDERKLFVANIRSGSVTIIERATDKVTSVPTAAGAEGIDVSPDGREVWVTNRAADSIAILDTASDAIVATIPSGGKFPIRAKFTPDGKEVWVSNLQSNTVVVFNAAARKPLATIEVGAAPVGIVIAPDGRRAYVANTNANQVTVFDVPARKALGTFTTGTEPDGMAWAK